MCVIKSDTEKNKLILIIIDHIVKLFQVSLAIILGIIDELENTHYSQTYASTQRKLVINFMICC